MFNGSTIASLVDVSSGYAGASAKPEDSYFTTVELKVNYLNPAIGEQLVAKAQVIKNGKVLTVVRSDVFAVSAEGKETLAATSLVKLMQLSNKSTDKHIDYAMERKLSKYRILPEKVEQLHQWMQTLNSRKEELLQTLENENVYIENIMLSEEEG